MPAKTVLRLSPGQRRRVVDQAIVLFNELYVHLPLKEAMHAVRPLQRLRLLVDELDALTDREFHSFLLEIFNSVRDLHTNYVLPNPHANVIVYLPFQVESYFEDGQRHYAMTHWVSGFSHPTFVPGVEILHWGGTPIARAVEISGEQHAGSNRDARHARGVDGLTIRPLAQSLPPDTDWVDVRYRGINDKVLEERFEWLEFEIDDDEDAIASIGDNLSAATAIGLDLGQDLIRRASKKLFVPDVVALQRKRYDEEFPFPDIAQSVVGKKRTASANAGRDLSDRPWPGRDSPGRDFPRAHFAERARRRREFPAAAFTARGFPETDFPNTDFPDTDFPDTNFGNADAIRSEMLARGFPDRDFPTRNFPRRGFPETRFGLTGFSVRDWPHSRKIPMLAGKPRNRGSVAAKEGAMATALPQVFDATAVDTQNGSFGYIRIRTFSVVDEWEFLSEFVRLTALLPQRGLIIDVRGNGGGLILAGELLLQTLTPHRVEPERVQFINTPLTRSLIAHHSGNNRPFADFDLSAWRASSMQANRTGATYTQAFPITDPGAANLVGQQYHGPVTLITDARCYSTTDIFAAGFQDHDIGPIIGIDGNTGAGGANVWTHDLLRDFFDGVADSPIKTLPKKIAMRVAIRRTLRTAEAAGTPVEDLGVIPDIPYAMTRRDLLDGNVDLIEFAAGTLASRPVYQLQISNISSSGSNRRASVRTDNLERLDIYLDDRPLRSLDVSDGTTRFSVPSTPNEATLDLRGYKDRRLVAARRAFLKNNSN